MALLPRVILLLSLLPLLLGAAAPKHLLVVVIDDLGFDDLGFRNEGQIKTPHFNALAHSGIILDSYYVQPSCSPTRATIMVRLCSGNRALFPTAQPAPAGAQGVVSSSCC